MVSYHMYFSGKAYKSANSKGHVVCLVLSFLCCCSESQHLTPAHKHCGTQYRVPADVSIRLLIPSVTSSNPAARPTLSASLSKYSSSFHHRISCGFLLH